ncbi:MAG TPA: ACT domain-containing protein [Mycobacteriales bacterium]|nr:ACT domain-containing protein [Mycobacteriales bacterium]
MSYLLRVVVPDQPGTLGAVATALGQTGADIVSVDIVERTRGQAVDDLVVDLPYGRMPDVLVTAATSVPGVLVESIRPYGGGPLDTSRELEVIEAMAERPADAIIELATALPRIFRAGWAVVVYRLDDGYVLRAASAAAPEMAEVRLPWLPVAKAVVLEPEDDWVPTSWQNLGTELVAAPLGVPERAVLLGRPGGPAFRSGEVMRLAHLTGIAATVLAAAR